MNKDHNKKCHGTCFIDPSYMFDNKWKKSPILAGVLLRELIQVFHSSNDLGFGFATQKVEGFAG